MTCHGTRTVVLFVISPDLVPDELEEVCYRLAKGLADGQRAVVVKRDDPRPES